MHYRKNPGPAAEQGAAAGGQGFFLKGNCMYDFGQKDERENF